MKVSIVFLAVLLALCNAQEPRDPYQKVTYNIFYPGTTVICATWSLAGQFVVPYHTNDGEDSGEINVMINLPQLPPMSGNATQGDLGSSMCPTSIDNTTWTSSLSAQFSNGENFVMMASGSGDEEPTSWQVDSIWFTYNEQDMYYFPGGNGTDIVTVNITNPDMIDIRGGQNQLFSCNSESDLTLSAAGQVPIPFSYKDMLLGPFTNSTSGSTAECSADTETSSSKTVPIAVGAALGGLLLLVLVAYLIGRRMRRGSGYQKV
eukprot:scpid57277/ scgid33005/ 